MFKRSTIKRNSIIRRSSFGSNRKVACIADNNNKNNNNDEMNDESKNKYNNSNNNSNKTNHNTTKKEPQRIKTTSKTHPSGKEGSTNKRNTMKRRGGISTTPCVEERENTGFSTSLPASEGSITSRSVPRRGGVVLTSSAIVHLRDEKIVKNESMKRNEGGIIDKIPIFRPEDRVTPSKMDIIIDIEKGFYVDHGANDIFLAILRTYFVDKYSEASSKTHRGIILSTILDEIYSRRMKFLWKNYSEQHFILDDDMIILRYIKSTLKKL